MLVVAILAASMWMQGVASEGSSGPPKPRPVSLPTEIPKWLAGGEHKDFPWKVHIERPVLTYQQREVLKAVAKISGPALQEKSNHRDLMFIIRVADENGHWLPGGNFVTQELEKPLHHGDVEMESEVLLRPGKYILATILYDSVLGEHNVTFNRVEVPPLGDPLAQMLDKTARAEFVRGDMKGIDTFASGRPYLPLNNHRPVEFDLLVDLSGREHHMRPRTVFNTAASTDTTLPSRFNRMRDVSYFVRLLQSATVLASMKPTDGCMLVSAFNATKREVVLKPAPAENVDWDRIHDQQVGPDKDTISVAALEERKDVPQFVQTQFHALMKTPSCYEGHGKPLRVVVVLTHGLQFPDGSHKTKAESCDCKVFYLRQAETAMMIDDLKNIFSDLNPKVFEYSDPDQFRHKLADLIKEIDAAAK